MNTIETRHVNILLKEDRIITDRDYFNTEDEAKAVVYEEPLVYLKTTEVELPNNIILE